MQVIDMKKVYRYYRGKWVALKKYESNPEVIASAKTLKEVLKKAEAKGFNLPLVMQIPKEILPIVGPYIIK